MDLGHPIDGRAGDLSLSAAALGLLAGVKFYAVGDAAVAGLVTLAAVWRLRGGRSTWRICARMSGGRFPTTWFRRHLWGWRRCP